MQVHSVSSKGTLFWKHSNDVIMQRNTVLILLVRFNVESYKVVKSDQLLVQGGRVPVQQVEKQCGRDLPSRHCQDRTTQLEQLDMWQEARYVVQVYRHQQQTMTLTRAGHTTGRACMRNCEFLHEQVRGSRGRNGAQRAPEVGTGGPAMPGPRSGPLSSSGACAARSSDKSRRVSRLAPGCCCGGGFYRCWWWAEHTARLRANIHSVSALLPGACVPCCCT